MASLKFDVTKTWLSTGVTVWFVKPDGLYYTGVVDFIAGNTTTLPTKLNLKNGKQLAYVANAVGGTVGSAAVCTDGSVQINDLNFYRLNNDISPKWNTFDIPNTKFAKMIHTLPSYQDFLYTLLCTDGSMYVYIIGSLFTQSTYHGFANITNSWVAVPTVDNKLVNSFARGGRDAGDSSVMMIMEDGSLQGFGSNRFGELGLNHTNSVSNPTNIPLPNGKIARSVHAGGSYFIVLCTDGSLYSVGNGFKGQLGLGDFNDRTVLTPITLANNKTAAVVSTGKWHAGVVCTDGTIQTWGWGDNGQLGIENDTTDKHSPNAVPLANSKTGLSIACTYNATTVICTDGTAQATGSNAYNVFGMAVSGSTVFIETGLTNNTDVMTAPDAPTINSISASQSGGNQVDFVLTPPVNNGGGDIIYYTITATPSSGSPISFRSTSASGTMPGLTDGATYTFVATCSNQSYTSVSSSSTTFTLPTRPGAPTSLSTAPPADGAILVSWQDPVSTPVSIDYYVVTNTTTNQSQQINYGSYSAGSTYSYNFTGLTNGITYTFTVVAHNTAGNLNSPTATISDFPAKAPLAPAKPTVAVGNAQIDVSWSVPSNGGSAITGYKVQYTDQSNNSSTVTFNNTATTQTITGLTNGVAYTFTVAAFSAKYSTGLNYSPSSDSIIPYAPLTAPTTFVATKGNGQVALTWYDPSPTNNYLVIDYYTVTNTTTNASTNVNFASGGGIYSYTFTGLTNGTTYGFTVKAHSSTVTPAVFGPSASASAIPSSVPSAPAKPTGVAGNGQVVVSWTAPNNQGSTITGYTVTASPGGATTTVSGTTLTATINGLTNDTAYTFVVYATNANGNSANSAASDAVTPVLGPDAPTVSSAASNGTQITITWTAPTSGVTPNGYAVDVSYNGATFGRVNVATATSYIYTIPDTAFGGHLYTAQVYAYKGVYASAVFSPVASKVVDDISHGLNFWLDASDLGAFSLGDNSSIGGKNYTQITSVIDKSSKGNNGTMYSSTGGAKPIYVYASDSATLGAINTAGYASIPTWTQNIGHEKPSILFRSANQEFMSANLGARNSPMTFLAVYVNFGANTSFGESGVPNTLIDYGGNYRFFMTNSTGSAATYSTPPSSLGYVIRSGYPNAANTSYSARINGATYDTTGAVQGINTFLINRRDDSPITYNDILISEVLIYNRALNDTEMAMAEGYLAARWGLLEWLPVGHPYKTGYTGIIKTTPKFYSGSFEGFGARDAVSYMLNNTFDPLGVDQYFTTKTPTVVEAYIALRSELKKQATTLDDKQKVKKSVLSSIRTKNNGGSTFVMTANEAELFSSTLDATSGFVKGSTLVIVPNYTLSGGNYVGSYTFSDSDWAYVTDATKNFVFDVPATTGGISYALTLTRATSSITFTYNGTVLSDGTNTYAAGASFTLADQTIKLTGLGSGMGNGGGDGGGGGGGGAGDPYITTVSGVSYKLPVMDGAIRFYQGLVDGHMLTVNATLKTMPSDELVASNLRSLIEFAPALGRKKTHAVMKKLFESEETLCFFEKFYISHNGREIVLDVWEQKIRVCSHSGVFPMKLVKNGDKALEKTQIYSGYSGTTLQLSIGKDTEVHISVFDSPIVRSGLFVNAPSMGKGNGVIVDALSKSEMTLDNLSDTSAVTCSGKMIFKQIKESFIDKSGTRVRNVLMSM